MPRIKLTRTLVYEGERDAVLKEIGKYSLREGETRPCCNGGTLTELKRNMEVILSPVEKAWNDFVSYNPTFPPSVREIFYAGYKAAEREANYATK